jgi:hypothetical protein
MTRAGNGNLSTDSGVLANTPYSFRARFENENGTNPEELIGSAPRLLRHGARIWPAGRRLHPDRAHDRGRGHTRTRRQRLRGQSALDSNSETSAQIIPLKGRMDFWESSGQKHWACYC